MKLTDEDITELQRVWKRSFGEEITAAEAAAHGGRLLELYVILGKLPAEPASTEQRPEAPDPSV
jgi:hypothetical protein